MREQNEFLKQFFDFVQVMSPAQRIFFIQLISKPRGKSILIFVGFPSKPRNMGIGSVGICPLMIRELVV